MNITYASHHYEITSDDREYAAEKVASLSKIISKDSEVKIEFTKEGKHKSGVIYRVDMTAFGAGKTHAVGHGETMREAIDMAKDEIKRRVTREKGRATTLTRAGGAQIKKVIKSPK